MLAKEVNSSLGEGVPALINRMGWLPTTIKRPLLIEDIPGLYVIFGEWG